MHTKKNGLPSQRREAKHYRAVTKLIEEHRKLKAVARKVVAKMADVGYIGFPAGGEVQRLRDAVAELKKLLKEVKQ